MAALLFGILICGVCLGFAGTQARAEKETGAESASVLISAELSAVGRMTYDIQVTITNYGQDWEGTARLLVGEDYKVASAYDTAISLPQGSVKQFTVRIPRGNIEVLQTEVEVILLDGKSRVAARQEFGYLLRDESNTLSMGILSDSYSDLTFLDMGGATLYFYYEERPVRLVELTQDNLKESLDKLTFLVIDNYNTGILTEEEMDAIEDWNKGGGVLVLGTGKRAEEMLSGFEDGYLGVEYRDVSAPADEKSTDGYLDVSKLNMADIRDTNGWYTEEYYSSGLACSVGDGAVLVLPYSLTELGKMDEAFFEGYSLEDIISRMLNDASAYAISRDRRLDSHYDYSDWLTRMLRAIGNSSVSLNFTVLKVLIFLYVVFAGPVLYVILRILKKRELYWMAVPASALVGIFLVFLAGRGFEVVSTKVYSVTAEDLSGRDGFRTYLYCYDASHREWDLRLNDRFDYVGTYENDNYDHDGKNTGVYYHHMKNEGDRLFFGIKPTANFEDSHFLAGGSSARETAIGTISGEKVGEAWGRAEGRVLNQTNRDFDCLAVVVHQNLYVYENLPAGGTLELDDAVPVYSSNGSGSYDFDFRDFYYNYLQDTQEDEKQRGMFGVRAALEVGLGSVSSQLGKDSVLIMGVTRDWEKAVDDNCSEVSYGCLYIIQ